MVHTESFNKLIFISVRVKNTPTYHYEPKAHSRTDGINYARRALDTATRAVLHSDSHGIVSSLGQLLLQKLSGTSMVVYEGRNSWTGVHPGPTSCHVVFRSRPVVY